MKERIFWLSCVFIAGLVAAYFWTTAERAAEKLAVAELENDEHRATIDSLRAKALLSPKTADVASNLRRSDVLRMKKMGLADPASDLVEDLMGRRDLIPIDGVLGGTMRFVKSDMVVLNDKWVLASFGDGQTSGRALLEYEVSEGGVISWGMLAYDMPERR